MKESLELRRDMRDSRGIADCLGALALLAEAGGDHETAARLLGAAEAQREAAGQVVVPWLSPFFGQIRTEASAALGERFDLALVEGRSLSRQDAIALTLDSVSVAAVR